MVCLLAPGDDERFVRPDLAVAQGQNEDDERQDGDDGADDDEPGCQVHDDLLQLNPRAEGRDSMGRPLRPICPTGPRPPRARRLRRRRPPPPRRPRFVPEQHHVGDDIGESEQALLQLGPIEGEQQIEHMLGGLRIAHRQVGLQQVDAGRRPVAPRVIPRRDEFDDLPRVTGHPEVAGNADQDVRAVAGGGEHLLVDRHRPGAILEFERFARRFEPGEHRSTPGDRHRGGAWTGFSRRAGGRRGGGRGSSRGFLRGGGPWGGFGRGRRGRLVGGGRTGRVLRKEPVE